MVFELRGILGKAVLCNIARRCSNDKGEHSDRPSNQIGIGQITNTDENIETFIQDESMVNW
jgi:hypothetical protein